MDAHRKTSLAAVEEYVCMHACIYVCMHRCACERTHLRRLRHKSRFGVFRIAIRVHGCKHMYASVSVCACVCVTVCTYFQAAHKPCTCHDPE